ncbi:MBL fold metallo-hydrolase [Shinella sp. CPCC 101442]|uniref:MBL fold metallo-hydrolase n=1 Tax=Shinella sp. CPCC 101442 TaxID=2932265 RepID=UPI0021537992|nr:MBL fold metallo-hydrolase [Shinella sp. CPCC 101442]MCR6497944.1 MBL fold metallo-hydrolase [Shinella sp. CPCC 101442]
MKPVFANSAFVTAPERLFLRGGTWRRVPLKVRYGIFTHPEAGLVLVDTGYGPRVTRGPRSPSLRLYNTVLHPELVLEGQPGTVLRKLGFTPHDVGTVILTHFHADHVAGLDLFPKARIIAKAEVLGRILKQRAWKSLGHGIFTELLPADLASRTLDVDGISPREAPLGLGVGRDLFGDGSVLAIDLPGHAEGHFGLCFTDLPKPLLYAVDAQWCTDALGDERHPGFPANLIADDASALVESARRVLAFRQVGGAVLLCHDPAASPYDFAQETP